MAKSNKGGAGKKQAGGKSGTKGGKVLVVEPSEGVSLAHKNRVAAARKAGIAFEAVPLATEGRVEQTLERIETPQVESATTATTETKANASEAGPPKEAKKREPNRTPLAVPRCTIWTFGEAVSGYTAAVMERSPNTPTGASYRRLLEAATGWFGADRKIEEITDEMQADFAKSEAALRAPNGKLRAKPTYQQLLRCVRLALEWART